MDRGVRYDDPVGVFDLAGLPHRRARDGGVGAICAPRWTSCHSDRALRVAVRLLDEGAGMVTVERTWQTPEACSRVCRP